MNELQKRFFEYLAAVQETCVEVCMIQHKCDDEKKNVCCTMLPLRQSQQLWK